MIVRKSPTRAEPSRPASTTRFVPSCVVYGLAAIVLFSLASLGTPPLVTAFAGLGIGFSGLLFIEWRWPSADRAGARVLRPLAPRNWPRVGVKLVGLAATLVAVTLFYRMFGHFLGKDTLIFMRLWPLALVLIAAAAPLVFAETDRRMADPEDAYYQIGNALLGRGAASWSTLRAHGLGWTVKAFFLPLMVTWFFRLVVALTNILAEPTGTPLATFFFVAMLMMFIVDLMGAFIGYSMTFKGLGSHIRSVNPMVTGWIAALICYPPFVALIEPVNRHIEDLAWTDKFAANASFWPLAAIVLTLQLIYTLATVNFGLRFSNLTNRGIVTGGVYRWVKHPAYFAKNSFWWLMSIPFFGTGPQARWAMVCIATINLIYFIRAKTEEKHLLADPAYQRYHRWIEEHGLFAPLTRARRRLAARLAPAPGKRRGWRTHA